MAGSRASVPGRRGEGSAGRERTLSLEIFQGAWNPSRSLADIARRGRWRLGIGAMLGRRGDGRLFFRDGREVLLGMSEEHRNGF